MKSRARITRKKDKSYVIVADTDKLRVGDTITIKRGAIRSLPQNSLYWVYLTWCINNGLKEHGHIHPEALHLNLKSHFISTKVFTRGKFKLIEMGSTTEMNKIEFGEYLEKCDHFINEFFGLNTSPFWEVYQTQYEVS